MAETKTPNPARQREAVQIIRQATDDMIEKDPFFGHIMDQLRLAPDSRKQCKTIETNGRILAFDTEWVIKARDHYGQDGMKAILAHEAAHIAFGHPYRLGDKDAETYGKATDAVVNDILKTQGYNVPKDGFFYPDARKYTSEHLYRLLKQQNGRGQDGDGNRKSSSQAYGGCFSPDQGTDAEEEAKAKGQQSGQPGDQPGDGEGDDSYDGESDVRENVARAAQKARKAGKMPGQYETMVDQSSLSSRSWKEDLRKFLGGGEKEPSWSKPNRRFIQYDQYLPGYGKFGPGEIVLAIDVSGSVQGELVEKFLREVRKINEDMQPDAIHVMTCDTRIPWTERFGPYDDVVVPRSAITGGGTAFSPVFKWVKENTPNAKAVVYFTDLECYDFGEKPECPVLWVVWPGGADRAPWGDVIHMDD